MKRLLPRPQEGPKEPAPRKNTKTAGLVGRALLTGTLLLAPLSKADTEEPPPQPVCMKAKSYEVQGERVILYKSETGGIYGCLSQAQEGHDTVLKVSDLTAFAVNFFPFVDFGSKQRAEITVAYEVEGEMKTVGTFVERSNLKIKGFKLPPGMEIGTPIVITFKKKTEGEALDPVPLVPLGHTIPINGPGGVVVLKTGDGATVGPRPTREEIASSDKPLLETSATLEEEVITTTSSDKPLLETSATLEEEVITTTSSEKPLEASAEDEATSSPIILLSFERLKLSGLGEHKNSGDINEGEILGMIDLTDKLFLVVGASASVNNMSADTGEAENNVGLLSINGVLGLRLNLGKHALFATPYGGVSYITPDLVSKLGERSSSYSVMDVEFGGRIGYEYDDIVGIAVQGSNNPFNPGLIRLFAALPYSWVTDAYPRIDVTTRWLHLIRPNADGELGGELDNNDVLTHANLKLPIAPLGPVLPSAIAGLEVNVASDNEVTVDGYFGGTLSLKVGGIRVEAGYLHSINGNYMIIVTGGLFSQ